MCVLYSSVIERECVFMYSSVCDFVCVCVIERESVCRASDFSFSQKTKELIEIGI